MSESRPSVSENVIGSVHAASQALAQLESSLVVAGFTEGQEAYTRMSELLVGQRLWVEESGLDDFDADFDHLSRLAARIYSILEPYLETMRRISALGEMERPTVRSQVLERLAERRGRAVSVAILADELAMERDDVEKALQTLVAENGVEIRRSSGRTLFCLPRAKRFGGEQAVKDSDGAFQ